MYEFEVSSKQQRTNFNGAMTDLFFLTDFHCNLLCKRSASDLLM